ncbi:hypothetical protein B0H17DRAFT_396637 [Mycena rosella]|uniref:Uncharacterized protein n=1 Tax=Mycena rosella TaxID=1033263 RepID=A0AAD7CMH4_MYCRO|nr:hypothetical protein B0H17DRAFT_396637 [Mycena rosella]
MDRVLVLCVPTLLPAPPQHRVRVGDLHPGTRPCCSPRPVPAAYTSPRKHGPRARQCCEACSTDSEQHGKGRTAPPDAPLRVHREQRLHRRRGVCVSYACADIAVNATPGAWDARCAGRVHLVRSIFPSPCPRIPSLHAYLFAGMWEPARDLEAAAAGCKQRGRGRAAACCRAQYMMPHVMVISSDGYFYAYSIDLERGGECLLVKQYSLLESGEDRGM